MDMATNSTIPITVVVPAYNEEARLPGFLDQLRQYLDREFSCNYEVVVVNDGSTDRLAGILENVQANWSQLRVLTHSRNLGKGAALATGVLSSVGELVLLCDADGATPIEEERLLRSEILKGADVAVASRSLGGRAKRHWLRRIGATLFSRVVRTIFRLGVRDTQCGFKMLRGDIARSLFQRAREKGYLVDLELLLLARNGGYGIVETPVSWREMPGSKLSLWKVAMPVGAGLWRLYRRSRIVRKSSVASSTNPGAALYIWPRAYRPSRHRTRRAVTLVEVLVAIAIFGLLLSLTNSGRHCGESLRTAESMPEPGP
jgi:dolichyl-phosphate beta-glucosyltransferase